MTRVRTCIIAGEGMDDLLLSRRPLHAAMSIQAATEWPSRCDMRDEVRETSCLSSVSI